MPPNQRQCVSHRCPPGQCLTSNICAYRNAVLQADVSQQNQQFLWHMAVVCQISVVMETESTQLFAFFGAAPPNKSQMYKALTRWS